MEIEVPKEVMQEVKVSISKEQMIQLQKNDEYIADVSLEEHEQSEN